MTENTISPAGPDVQGDESRPIVSVNSGPRAASPWAWYGVLALGFVVICAGALFAISKLRVREAVMPVVASKPVGTSIDPSSGFGKPIVSAPTEQNSPTVSIFGGSAQETASSEPCPNKVLLDPTGAPIIGSDGKPIATTCDGRSLPRRATPTVSIAGAPVAGAVGDAALPPPPPDRYGGGVIIEPPPKAAKPGEITPEIQQALDTVQRLQSSQAAPDPAARAAVGSSGLRLEGFGRQDPGAATAPDPQRAGTSNTAARAQSSETTVHEAKLLRNRKLTVMRGSQIECFLTLAYVSDAAGEAHCVVARDVYGQDGTTILIDRGSVVSGLFLTVTGLGERRASVIWEQLTTPSGVYVTLASKGTDALGSTGIPAKVDNRWFDRLGMAAAVSLVKDVSTAVAARRAASGAASELVSSSQNFADQILNQTLAIRPSLYVKQGDAASIVLQAHLDFSRAYADKR